MRERPTTAWELCEGVCDAIEHAPANYYQEAFAIAAEDLRDSGRGAVSAEMCGTAFCRAGWMCAIMDAQDKAREPEGWMGIDLYNPAVRCLRAAGIPREEIDNLFDGGVCKGDYGTESYVKSGIAGMKAFMERHEEKLKAHKLEESWELKREVDDDDDWDDGDHE